MPTRMTHPRHGTTHAVGAEIEWNIKNGWKVDEKPPKEQRAEAQESRTLSVKPQPKA